MPVQLQKNLLSQVLGCFPDLYPAADKLENAVFVAVHQKGESVHAALTDLLNQLFIRQLLHALTFPCPGHVFLHHFIRRRISGIPFIK